jgi:hypothetical protein
MKPEELPAVWLDAVAVLPQPLFDESVKRTKEDY